MPQDRTDHPPVDGGYTCVCQKRACNLHRDCDAADEASLEKRGVKAYHCSVEDCEDCFGC